MDGHDSAKVLIVDDEPRNLDALEAMLGSVNCSLVRATSADEALLALLQNDFAAIVLDIQMPGMNGIELARLIKERQRSRHIPILFLTAHMVDENDVLRGYGVGAVDYLSKPINADILRSKVGAFVDTFRKTLALAELNEALQREVAGREKAQAALQQANQELERRVQERTLALTRAHMGVRENEERLRMAMQIAQTAAWEWHLATGHMTWSTNPEQLLGFPYGSFGPELRISRAIHPEDAARVEDAVANAVKTGAYEAEYRVVRPNGTIVWVTERARLQSDSGVNRMVGVTRDVTLERESAAERERLLKRERDARDEAERQSRLKDEFLATLSHELRTPVNAILGWIAILQSGKPIRDTQSALTVVRRNAQIQAQLIEDLLDMNRLISGTLKLERSDVDVAALLQTTMEGLQPAADAKGVILSTSVDQGIGRVLVDARRLQQVFWNLVHNAIKFTSKGGHVEVKVERTADMLRFAVRDDGQGISRAFLPHVFERFRQQDSSSTRTSSGLGLGLSITKDIVELHGGTISAFSEGDGCGSTFMVSMPLAELRGGTTAPLFQSAAAPTTAVN